MVLEKQDSGVCLSVEPTSPTSVPTSDDPRAFHWSREEGRRAGGKGRAKLTGSVDGLESLKSPGSTAMGDRATEEGLGGEGGLRYSSVDARRLRMSETVPDLTDGGSGEGDLLREDNDGSGLEDGGRASFRCSHRLLLSDQDGQDGNRSCQLCRKKEERLSALRRAAGNDDEDGPFWSSPGLTKILKSAQTKSPSSTESPPSPTNSDRGQFDPRPTRPDSRHFQSNGHHRLAPPSGAMGGSQSPRSVHSFSDDYSGRSSPRLVQQTGQHQNAILQKLQGALSKMSPRIFKPTKGERPVSAVGSQDQKILALMLAKKEEEERQRVLREMSHRQWEEEMRLSRDTPTMSSVRATSFRRRRHTGDPGTLRRKDKTSTSGEANSEDGGGSEPQTPCTAHGASQSVSSLDDRDGGAAGSENLDKGRRTPKSRTEQKLLQQQKSREKQIQAMERKKSVEQRLEQQRREMEEHQLQMRRKQEQDLERANSVRMSREQQQILKTKLKNLQAQQKQDRINQIKRQSMVDLSCRQEEIQNKLSKAELKAQHLKQEDARKRREELEKRIEQSRHRQEQIEEEQSKWQEELLKYQKWKDYQADGLAKATVAKKREAACADRIKNEKLQRDNMKRLLNQEERWLNDVEASIAMKDARIRTVQKEKEEQIQRNRAVASAYQRMREELKTHYSMSDLDQVAQKLAIENRLVPRE